MNPFITFREKDKAGDLQYYILQREFPHYVGLISGRPSETAIAQVSIPGHYLWVVFNGVLAGNLVPAYNGVDQEIIVVLDRMAAWFHSERILLDEKRFKKFKIASHGSQPA